MSRFLITAFVLMLFSCSNKTNEKKSNDKYKDNYIIDTVLSEYSIKVILLNQYLKKGIDNQMILEIKDVPNDKVVIYTKTSEATVKLNNDTSGYLILPKITSDSVGINININNLGKMIVIGKIYIKTE